MYYALYNNMRMISKMSVLAAVLAVCVSLDVADAAVGCTLSDPDQDIRRIFPEATNYKTEFLTIAESGGADVVAGIEEDLGDKFDPVYEALNVPYTYYTVLKGKEVIGRVHGVNQKGKYGGMQLILATDLKGQILSFYYQKLSSPEAKIFMKASFVDKFKGMTVENIDERVEVIDDPSEKSAKDYKATLRGVKKNLLLLSYFKINKKEK